MLEEVGWRFSGKFLEVEDEEEDGDLVYYQDNEDDVESVNDIFLHARQIRRPHMFDK